MSPLRILLISRRFWPLTGDAVSRSLQWCCAMQRRGHIVSVLTARWHPNWPERIILRDLDVHRIGAAPNNFTGRNSYLRNIRRWIQLNSEQYDIIIADQPGEEAGIAVARGTTDLPVVMRFDPVEIANPDFPAPIAVATAQATCRRARAVIVPRATAEQRLLSSGPVEVSVRRIADGIGGFAQGSKHAQLDSRRCLASVNRDLTVQADDRVILSPVRLNRRWGVDTLIQAVGPLVGSDRKLHLWLIGDGEDRDRIFERMRHMAWHHQIRMPGCFDDTEDLFSAADMCIIPSAGMGLAYYAQAAIASGTPTILADSPEARSQFGSAIEPLLVTSGDPVRLRNAVVTHFRESESPMDSTHSGSAITYATAAVRGHLVQTMSIDKTASEYESLFRQILQH